MRRQKIIEVPTKDPKTDTEEIRGKLGQKPGRGDEDDVTHKII
jgi:hypothetical protein